MPTNALTDTSDPQTILPPALREGTEPFRSKVRAFLAEHLPPDWVSLGTLEEPRRKEWLEEWRKKLADHGMICVAWPAEYGGQGRSLAEHIALLEEFANAAAPTMRIVDTLAIYLLGPTLLAMGTEEQKRRILPRIVSGEDRWCQGYSEPGAGSDLAAVNTSATLKDGQWVINGQKIWTTCAHEADWMFALVRTDRSVSKYKGLTFLLIPMAQPGIEVRPILDMNRHHDLNEVFFSDAVSDRSNVLGEVNGGWAAANALLGYERNDAAIRDALNLRNELGRLIEVARNNGAAEDATIRARLAQAYVDVQAITHGAVRALSAALQGKPPGPESSVHKLLWTEYHQRVTTLALDILGSDALTPDGRSSATYINTDALDAPYSSRSWVETYFAARAGTIYAGTSEIQRNIIAERVLGLPRLRPATPKDS